jgi:hypothetical protein
MEIKPFSLDDLDALDLPGAVEQKQENIAPTLQVKGSEQEPIVEQEIKNEESEESNLPDDALTTLLGIPTSTKKEEVKETKEEAAPDAAIDYSVISQYLIEKGIWDEFETEGGELDAESFGELMALQAERKVALAEKQRKETFDNTSNQLIDFLNNGGHIQEFLENYNTTVNIESISLDSPEGQKEAIKTFYESIGKDKKWIEKQINRLSDEGDEELAAEAKDCKERLLVEYEEQRSALIKEQEAIAKDRKIKAETFNKNLRTAIHSDKELVDREKKELEKFIFEYKYEDENTGQKFSEFGKQFMEIQRDPKKYYKLLRFVKNPDNFEDKKVTEKEVTKKQFDFLKKGAAQTLNNVVSEYPERESKKTGQKIAPAFKFI